MHKLTLPLLCLLILATSCAVPKWMNGSWEGTGNQIDGKTWKVEMVSEAGVGTEVSYPGLNCGGIWDLRDTRILTMEFQEEIEYGTEFCDQHVRVVVKKLMGNRIHVKYYLPGIEGPIAEAILVKVEELG